jgi:flagellar motility protein MotE (MotC chaperone)
MSPRDRWLALALLAPWLLAADPHAPAVAGHEPGARAHGEEPAEPEAEPAEPEAEPAEPADEGPLERERLHSDAAMAIELDARKAALLALQHDIESKLEELRRLRAEAQASLEAQEKEHRIELGKLVAFYQSMKPKKAAELIEKLPLRMASEVIAAMKARSAGKILDQMQSEKAVEISRYMADAR